MRLWRPRSSPPDPIVATNAVPPTYATFGDFQSHALRFPQNGWFEQLPVADRVGTVNRCLQLNSQQIATMPLRYRHSETAFPFQPWWVTDPDPAWYPNGIGDAVFALVWSIYAAGDAFLWVTSRYETGFPRTWTVLDPARVKVADGGGRRAYRSGNVWLDDDDVVQISRNPTGALRGTPALQAYWANVQSAYQAEVYAADVYGSTGVNRVALKSSRRLDAAQAAELQGQWVEAVSRRLGAPAILPPDLEFLETLSVSPKDMMLLDSREWDARQIAAAFGVPAMLLNIAVSGGLTYQSPVQLFELWWRSELMPVAAKIAAALSRWLPRGHWVEFDPSRATQPDLAGRQQIYSAALADGAVTVDEYRAEVFGLPPMERGDQAEELFAASGEHASDNSQPFTEVEVP